MQLTSAVSTGTYADLSLTNFTISFLLRTLPQPLLLQRPVVKEAIKSVCTGGSFTVRAGFQGTVNRTTLRALTCHWFTGPVTASVGTKCRLALSVGTAPTATNPATSIIYPVSGDAVLIPFSLIASTTAGGSAVIINALVGVITYVTDPLAFDTDRVRTTSII